MAREPVPRNVHPAVGAARSRVGALAARGASPETLAQARADLAAANLQSAVERAAAAAPPLTAEQRVKLACLLLSDPPSRPPNAHATITPPLLPGQPGSV